MYGVVKLRAATRGEMTGEWQFTSRFNIRLVTVFCSNSSISTLVDLYAQKTGGYCDRNYTLTALMNPCTKARFQPPFFGLSLHPER